MVIKGVNLMEETVGGLMQRVRDCMSSLSIPCISDGDGSTVAGR
jgi:hypothetical protein